MTAKYFGCDTQLLKRVATIISLLSLLFISPSATASTYKVLYSFCPLGDGNCTDGDAPFSGLAKDGSGNLFGTTRRGGAHDMGTVYELSPGLKQWHYTLIYSFCSKANCADGYAPVSTPVIDVSGNIYGTTIGIGATPKIGKCSSTDCGIAFELVSNKGKWKFALLHKFTRKDSNGIFPSRLSYAGAATGAFYDGASPLFGTAAFGGASNEGTVFMLTPQSGTWTDSILHSFCENCMTDGSGPEGGLLVLNKTTVLGTTVAGGAQTQGTLFELSAKKGSWREKILYNFDNSNSLGSEPTGELKEDAQGNLYGVAGLGNTPYAGVVWEFSSGGQYTKLWNFDSRPDVADGASPTAMTIDPSDHLYGTANIGGGASFAGTFFKLACCNTGGLWHDNTIHTFCAKSGCPDGSGPEDDVLLMDSSGDIFGTAGGGGANGRGVVFEVTP